MSSSCVIVNQMVISIFQQYLSSLFIKDTRGTESTCETCKNRVFSNSMVFTVVPHSAQRRLEVIVMIFTLPVRLWELL